MSAVRPRVATQRAREGREGAQVPWWVSLALLPARVVLAVVLVVLRPPPSDGVLARIGGWGRGGE